MAKKYLSIEEACSQLGIGAEEMNRLREAGEIRGFADRGTWKFKPEDVDELLRTRQADSSPSVPMLDSDVGVGESEGDGSSVVLGEEGSSVVLGEGSSDGSSVLLGDSSVLMGDEDDVGQQPTIVRKDDAALGDVTGSDSDVRLVLDDSLTEDSSPNVAAPEKPDSDSDVRLVGDAGSDSDVKLVSDASDSDVRLAHLPETPPPSTDSDSDVQLVGDASHSDIVLASPTAEEGSDSDVKLIGSDATDDDIAVSPLAGDSASSLSDPDSGISLEPADSGIALEAALDSGISLMSDEDSGISLAGDSGISLAGDSGIALEALNAAGPRAGDLDETQFELDALDEDSEFELSEPGSGSGSDTGVIVFDDDEAVDDRAQTMIKPGSDDDFASGAFEFDDDLEVAEDVVGEDDELDDIDVFDAGDEDFAESFEAGESHAEFVAPPGALVAPVQQDWGVATFLGLILTSAVMILCCVIMFDFVRSMWSWNEPSGFTSALMSKIGGMFGK
ncbi:MAG: helix-turn-helix domain-containing protein [Planctomycetaceae bacterium]